ncbi:MAG: hypothetical protein JO167_02040 [Alphaproteobacteria bacterium]|nr:hypothetical protein [Alphaproteobacteria bacterium]MBV9540022.1 hypothetical protein [Alphaproteobacteria bacterium]MBV9905541.1 hypothetical protein [Alphaproteobacteria bacterium]
MAEKKHDLRDDIYAPRGTPDLNDEKLAGAEPASVDPEKGNLKMVTPEVGKNTPDGVATKG